MGTRLELVLIDFTFWKDVTHERQGIKTSVDTTFPLGKLLILYFCVQFLFTGDTFQDPQWVPETTECQNLYVLCLLPIHTYL